MDKKHKERMNAIGSVAMPPKGTQAHAWLQEKLKEQETPEFKKYVKQLYKKAHAIVTGQQLNGAGHETDQSIRWLQSEYNNRAWSHGLHSLPSTFNVAEAFFEYAPQINAFILHQENNHLFSFADFVNWYTSEDTTVDPKEALECMVPGVIYTFDSLLDPADLLYGLEGRKEVGISGFAMVRFGTEISVFCVAGEKANLDEKSKEIKIEISKCQFAAGRKDITPDPELIEEAVPLESKQPLWRLIALTRFDINDMSQSVRYVCHDAGTSYLITTDDPNTFLNIEGDFLHKDLEEIAKKSAEKIREYNDLFDLCSTSLFLPLYFEKFAEDVVVERFKTNYADKVRKLSFQKIQNNIPHDLKVTFRNVNVLRKETDSLEVSSTIYSIPNFHTQSSGYWRKLEPGKIGADKKGKPIHGRTWVSKKITWMETEEPNALIAKRVHGKSFPSGPNPGFIYVMRSPLQAKNVFKVGLTKRTTQERADELSSSTGVPGKIYVMYEWAVGDCVSIEKNIHKQLSDYRVDPRREFFEVPLSYLVSIIEDVIDQEKGQ